MPDVELNDPADIFDPTTSAAFDALHLTHRGAPDRVKQLRLQDLFASLRKAGNYPAVAPNATVAQLIDWLYTIGFAAAPVAWSPLAISNLAQWWKPSPATTWQDAGLTIPGAVGQTFSTLVDRKAAYNVAQAVDLNKPTLVLTGSNYGMHCTTNRTWLASAAVPVSSDFECVCVFSWPFVMNAAGAQVSALFGREPAATGSRVNGSLQNNSVGRINAMTYNSAGGYASVYPAGPPAAAALGMFRTQFSWAGGNSTVSARTTNNAVVTNAAATALTAEGNGEWRLGRESDAGGAYDTTNEGVTLYECFRTAGALSGVDAALLATYVTNTYGVTY